MSENNENSPNPNMYGFTERELALIENCVDYASSGNPAGLPGHNLLIIIAKYHTIVNALVDRVTFPLSVFTPVHEENLNEQTRVEEALRSTENLFESYCAMDDMEKEVLRDRLFGQDSMFREIIYGKNKPD